jgi:hypothetical protein
LFSAVWDSKIRVPDSQSLTQLKDREGKKAVTPFNFEKEKEKAKSKEKDKGKDRAMERWHPTMCEAVLGKRPVEGDVDGYDTSSSLDWQRKKPKSKARRELIPKSRIERADADADAAAVPRGGGKAKATARSQQVTPCCERAVIATTEHARLQEPGASAREPIPALDMKRLIPTPKASPRFLLQHTLCTSKPYNTGGRSASSSTEQRSREEASSSQGSMYSFKCIGLLAPPPHPASHNTDVPC